MYVRKIHIYGFGNIIDCVAETAAGVNKPLGNGILSDGLVFLFVRCMLYGMGGRGDTDMRARLRPVPQSGRYVKYGGEMTYDAQGRRFRLTRLFGNSAGDDVIELIDLDSGRDVKIEAGRTPGEKSLRLTEGAFVTAACIHAPSDADFTYDASKGGYILGNLSCMGSLNDNKPSPHDIAASLEKRLRRITDPSTQSGLLDRAVIRKMSMRNELSRIGDIDNKINAKTAELQSIAEQRNSIKTTLDQDRRTNMLSRAAKGLLAKDRIMAEYERLTQLLRELDVRNAEHKALSERKITGSLIPALIAFAIAIGLIVAGFLNITNSIGNAAIAAGFAFMVAGTIILPLATVAYRNRFYVKRDGVKVLLDDEIARLRDEIAGRNADILKLLGDKTADEADEEWRRAEILMRNATDDERRFAVLKMSDEADDKPEDDGQLDSVNRQIAGLQAEIDELCKSFGKTFSTASLALEGIDEEIKRLNDEAEAVRLSIVVAESASDKLRHDVLPEVIKGARARYRSAFGEEPVFKCNGSFEIVTSADDPLAAYCAFLLAASDTMFGETRNTVFVSPADGKTSAGICDAIMKLDAGRVILG
ncbi:MAG: hypothetical protein ILO53_08140 [Clostridia bacterium]|nr:hypothetical protein [Clostridia bacterium]